MGLKSKLQLALRPKKNYNFIEPLWKEQSLVPEFRLLWSKYGILGDKVEAVLHSDIIRDIAWVITRYETKSFTESLLYNLRSRNFEDYFEIAIIVLKHYNAEQHKDRVTEQHLSSYYFYINQRKMLPPKLHPLEFITWMRYARFYAVKKSFTSDLRSLIKSPDFTKVLFMFFLKMVGSYIKQNDFFTHLSFWETAVRMQASSKGKVIEKLHALYILTQLSATKVDLPPALNDFCREAADAIVQKNWGYFGEGKLNTHLVITLILSLRAFEALGIAVEGALYDAVVDEYKCNGARNFFEKEKERMISAIIRLKKPSKI